MRIEDARKIVAVLMVTYQNYRPIDSELAARTWADLTAEYTYEQVNLGLRAYMKSNASGFAPVPGQLIEIMQNMITPEQLNEMEAWALVSKAIRSSGYNSTEEFAKLPPLVQKAVGLPGQLRIWALDENYNEDVISSNFIKCYRSEIQKEKVLQKMPGDVKTAIEEVNKGSHPAQIEQKRKETIENSSGRKQSLILAQNNATECVDISRYREKLESLLGGNGEDGRREI